jgi:hypothetical protein
VLRHEAAAPGTGDAGALVDGTDEPDDADDGDVAAVDGPVHAEVTTAATIIIAAITVPPTRREPVRWRAAPG